MIHRVIPCHVKVVWPSGRPAVAYWALTAAELL
jgi:hypothetical protein